MAVTNLGGGGVLETTTAGQRQTTDILSRLAIQQRGINAEAAAKQKEVDQATWTAAMQNYAQPFLNQGLSMGYVIEQNPELFRQALGNIMGSPEQAEAYMKQTMGAEETVEQTSMRQLFSQFKTNEEKFGLLNHLSGMTPEQKVQFAQEQQTAPPSGQAVTIKATDLMADVRAGKGLIEAEMDRANYTRSKEEWIESPQAEQSRGVRRQIWEAYGLEGAYTGIGDQNKTLQEAILGGNPQGIKTLENQTILSADGNSFLDTAQDHRLVAKRATSLVNPTEKFNQPEYKALAGELPESIEARAKEYLDILGEVEKGTDLAAGENKDFMNFARLPLEKQARFGMYADEFSTLSTDELRDIVKSPDKDTAVTKDLSGVQSELSFKIPESTPQGALNVATDQVVKGALSRYYDTASKMVQEGGRAAVPLLYENMLKETTDRLDISEKEAKTGLAIAQTQHYYDQIAAGRLVDEESGKPTNYTTEQTSAINRLGKRMGEVGFGFTFEGDSPNPSGFNMDKKNYSKDEWDNIGFAISDTNQFLAANPSVGRKLIGTVVIPQGQFKEQKLPVYTFVGSPDVSQATPTTIADVDSALGIQRSPIVHQPQTAPQTLSPNHPAMRDRTR